MKRALFGLFLVAALPVLAQSPILSTSVSELLKDADKFDGKEVSVKGTVSEFKQKTSRRGLPYFTFKLADKDQKINVYSQGTAEKELKEKQAVTVVGIYRKEKVVGGVTFKNEVDITGKPGKKFGVSNSAVIQ
jgi:cytochrome c-type biogenesis protein CcmE